MKSTCPIRVSGWVHKLALVLMSATFCISTARITEAVETLRSINVSEFGEVTFFGPKQVVPRGFAFLFSGEDGLVHDQTAIDRLIDNGVVVAAINSRSALQKMESLDAGQGCIDLARSLQRVSQGAQTDWKVGQYHPPILLGRGIGGALVYVALAQAWPYLFAGGISVDMTPTIKLDRTLCGLMTRAVNAGQRLTPQSLPLQSIWQVGSTELISPDVSALALAATRANDAGKIQVVGPKTLTALYYDAVDFFLKKATLETGRPGSLVSLPIVEISNDAAENTLVIVYSNDAGWQVIERGLVDVFKNEGYAVLGFDGSRYFWPQKTPASLAQDLAHIVEYYQYKWGVDRVVLVGYSSGATVIPFAYNRLAAKFQKSVSLMALISPKRAAQFVVGGSGWLDDKPRPVLWPLEPELRELDLDRVQCIYAHIEANDSLCTTTAMRKVELIEEPRIDPRLPETGSALAEFIISRIERGRQGDAQ